MVDEAAQRAFFADELDANTPQTEPFELSATVSAAPLLHNERPSGGEKGGAARPKLGRSSTSGLLKSLMGRPSFEEEEKSDDDATPRREADEEGAIAASPPAIALAPMTSPRGAVKLPPLPVAEEGAQQQQALPEGVAPPAPTSQE